MVRFARNSLGVRFVVALALSALVWAGLTLDQNPNATVLFEDFLTVEAINLNEEQFVLVSPLPSVRVNVEGPRVTLQQLQSADFVVRVDLDGLGSGAHLVGVSVTVSDPSVEVVRVTPPNFTVDLDPFVERTMPITARVESAVATGFRADISTITAEPAFATVSGAASAVDLVASVEAALSLEGATRGVSVQALLTPVDRQDDEVTDVRVDPQTALVNVPVERITSRKRVPVVAQIEGSVAPSSTIAQISIVPTTVEIEGEPSVLERVDAIQTLPVDISGAESDIQREVSFDVPAGVVIRTEQGVPQVVVVIEPLEDTITVQAAVVLTNLGTGLQAIADQPFSQIVVSGPTKLLQELRGGDILAEVDLRNRSSGLHQIRSVPMITNQLADALRIVRIEPEIVDVRISVLETNVSTPAVTAIPGPGGAVPTPTATPTPVAG